MHNSGTRPFLRNLKIKNISKRKLIKNWVSCLFAPCLPVDQRRSSGDGLEMVYGVAASERVLGRQMLAVQTFILPMLHILHRDCPWSAFWITSYLRNLWPHCLVPWIIWQLLLSGGCPEEILFTGYYPPPENASRRPLIDDAYRLATFG